MLNKYSVVSVGDCFLKDNNQNFLQKNYHDFAINAQHDSNSRIKKHYQVEY